MPRIAIAARDWTVLVGQFGPIYAVGLLPLQTALRTASPDAIWIGTGLPLPFLVSLLKTAHAGLPPVPNGLLHGSTTKPLGSKSDPILFAEIEDPSLDPETGNSILLVRNLSSAGYHFVRLCTCRGRVREAASRTQSDTPTKPQQLCHWSSSRERVREAASRIQTDLLQLRPG